MRFRKVGDKMSIIKTNQGSLTNFNDKRFYVNKFKNYPHDENLYLFKTDLVNKIELDKNQLVNNILELTINDDSELIEAAIKLYND